MSSSFTKYFLLFALTLSAAALTTPHARNVHHHRSLLARVPTPVAAIPALPPRRRSLDKRCKNNGTTTPAPSPSSSPAPVNVEPDPTVTPVAKHTPSHTTTTTKLKPTPSTTTTDAPAPSPAGFLSGTQTGDGTYYSTGLGSCGFTNTDSEDICAVSELLYDTYPGYNGGDPNSNPVCGRHIKATYQGKSVVVQVVDRCTGCSMTSLDFSTHAFNQIADPSVGRIHGMTWEWA